MPSEETLRVFASRLFRTNSQLAIGSFTDRLGEEIRTISKRQVNDSSFVCAHRFKRKRHSGLSHSIRGMIRHRLKLGFASRAKPMHITNQSRAASQDFFQKPD